MKNPEFQKIAIIGAGFVGSSIAFALMTRGIAQEIVLIDTNGKKAEGEAMDLMHGVPFVKPVDVYWGDYKECSNASMIVITAGSNQKPGETRMDLVHRNVAIFKSILAEIKKVNDTALLLVVTNPVDILTYVTYKLSGLPKERVIGSGTVLDTARFRSLIANHANLDARNVHGYVLGEHGDTEVCILSMTNIAGIPVDEYIKTQKQEEPEKVLTQIAENVKNAAYQIIERKGSTHYAVALGVTRIIECILRDENSILTVSSFLENTHGFSDVCLSLPTLVGKKGIINHLPLKLSNYEMHRLKESERTLKEVINQIKL